MKVITGSLSIREEEEGTSLWLVRPGEALIKIKPEDTLEIQLGDAWISGTFKPNYNYDNGKTEEPFDLFCSQQGFCGLRKGMTARVFIPDIETIKGEKHSYSKFMRGTTNDAN